VINLCTLSSVLNLSCPSVKSTNLSLLPIDVQMLCRPALCLLTFSGVVQSWCKNPFKSPWNSKQLEYLGVLQRLSVFSQLEK